MVRNEGTAARQGADGIWLKKKTGEKGKGVDPGAVYFLREPRRRPALSPVTVFTAMNGKPVFNVN